MTSANTDDDVAALRHLVEEQRGHVERVENENRALLTENRRLTAENFRLRNETSYG